MDRIPADHDLSVPLYDVVWCCKWIRPGVFVCSTTATPSLWHREKVRRRCSKSQVIQFRKFFKQQCVGKTGSDQTDNSITPTVDEPGTWSVQRSRTPPPGNDLSNPSTRYAPGFSLAAAAVAEMCISQESKRQELLWDLMGKPDPWQELVTRRRPHKMFNHLPKCLIVPPRCS